MPHSTALASLLGTGAFRELIKDVEIALIVNLPDDTTLFEEIVRYLSTNRLAVRIEHDLEVLSLPMGQLLLHRIHNTPYMSTRIVVA